MKGKIVIALLVAICTFVVGVFLGVVVSRRPRAEPTREDVAEIVDDLESWGSRICGVSMYGSGASPTRMGRTMSTAAHLLRELTAERETATQDKGDIQCQRPFTK